MNSAQQNYTVIEKELLSIVETLQHYRTILLGQEIIIYTDHKNLSFENLCSSQVLQWQIMIEEYNVSIHYLEGKRNQVVDALSRIPRLDEKQSFQPTQ